MGGAAEAGGPVAIMALILGSGTLTLTQAADSYSNGALGDLGADAIEYFRSLDTGLQSSD